VSLLTAFTLTEDLLVSPAEEKRDKNATKTQQKRDKTRQKRDKNATKTRQKHDKKRSNFFSNLRFKIYKNLDHK
jgi:hypothetical protein